MKFLNVIVLVLCIYTVSAQNSLRYEIDVTQSLDTFMVELALPQSMNKANNTFQFAATAPGTYQTQNVGRLVSDFKAYNKKGKALKVNYIAPNQYVIPKIKKATKITYKVAETFDTKLSSYPIYAMCGSSIEEDHTLINPHVVMGYFQGMQERPIEVKVIGKEDWVLGCALEKEKDFLLADDFDHLVDSPILYGDLSFAETKVDDVPIRIYTFSENGKFSSSALLENMEDMLEASRKFLVKLPVDKYTFLYYFLPNPSGVTGAWEHSYSSEYVLAENEPTEKYMEQVTDIASHEFFHIVTPLNIHSEIIESFNFVKPTPSQHLWLYEGVTEWASNILLFRGGVLSLEDYINKSIRQKIIVNERYFDKSWSLARLANESFNEDGAKQYGNIYYKGSLVAGYLDIRLLELSEGKRGLREVMLELVGIYGKGNPFSERNFFDDLVKLTYPEIGDFIHDYITNSEPLPHQEYLAKIGLNYTRNGDDIKIEKMMNPSDEQQMLLKNWGMNMELE